MKTPLHLQLTKSFAVLAAALLAGCARTEPMDVDRYHPASPAAAQGAVTPLSHTLDVEPLPAKTEKIITPSTQRSALFVCPMHPDVTADHAGTCPKCGMQLVKKDGQ